MLIQTRKFKKITSDDIHTLLYICITYQINNLTFFENLRMPAPKLPTWQDCHELWSKERRRQQRKESQGVQSAKPAKDVDVESIAQN